MYGVETYKKLPRNVPKYMQGLRLEMRDVSPCQIGRKADSERAAMSRSERAPTSRGKTGSWQWPGPSSETRQRIPIGNNGKWMLPALAIGLVLWIAS